MIYLHPSQLGLVGVVADYHRRLGYNCDKNKVKWSILPYFCHSYADWTSCTSGSVDYNPS